MVRLTGSAVIDMAVIVDAHKARAEHDQQLTVGSMLRKFLASGWCRSTAASFAMLHLAPKGSVTGLAIVTHKCDEQAPTISSITSNSRLRQRQFKSTDGNSRDQIDA